MMDGLWKMEGGFEGVEVELVGRPSAREDLRFQWEWSVSFILYFI